MGATGASETGGQIVPSVFTRIEKQRETTYCCSSSHPPNFWTFRRPCKVDNEDFFFLVRFFHNTIYRFHVTCTPNNWHFLLLFFPTTSKPHLFCHIYKFLCRSYILKNKKQE